MVESEMCIVVHEVTNNLFTDVVQPPFPTSPNFKILVFATEQDRSGSGGYNTSV